MSDTIKRLTEEVDCTEGVDCFEEMDATLTFDCVCCLLHDDEHSGLKNEILC